MNDWLKEINIGDIASEKMRNIAEVCGISVAISLMTKLPGIEIYVPTTGKKNMNLSYIRDHYKSKKISSISIVLGIARKTVERMIRRGIPKIKDSDIMSNDRIKLVAEICGRDVAIALIKNFAGDRIVIPMDGFSHARRKYIIRNFSGNNGLQLAMRCGLHERSIRKIIQEMYSDSSQTNLFE